MISERDSSPEVTEKCRLSRKILYADTLNMHKYSASFLQECNCKLSIAFLDVHKVRCCIYVKFCVAKLHLKLKSFEYFNDKSIRLYQIEFNNLFHERAYS